MAGDMTRQQKAYELLKGGDGRRREFQDAEEAAKEFSRSN